MTGVLTRFKELIIIRITTKTTGVLLAGAALCGLGSLSSLAYADTPSSARHTVGAPQQVLYSRGFLVYNLTSTPMTLKSVTGDGNFEGRPDVGSVLQPGQHADFEVQYRAFSVQNDDITYSNGSSALDARLTVDGLNDAGRPTSTCSRVSGPDDCASDGGTTIRITEPAGTVINIDGSQAQSQAAALKQFCAQNSDASCTFTPTGETNVDRPKHVLATETNNGTRDATLSVTKTDDVSSTNSVDLSASVGGNIAGLVDVQITAAYGHTWSQGHSFATGVSNIVPAGYYGQITAIAPMIRDTGNFTITVGNTTINLLGVYFDSPNRDGAEHFGYDEHPLSQAQKDSLPKTAIVSTR